MATKTEIQAFINTIGTGEANTALEFRTLLNNMLNDNYPTVTVEDNGMTGVITTKNTINTALQYSVKIVKIGRMVFLSGYCLNSSGSIVSNANLDDFFFEITSSEYLPTTANILSPIFPIYGANFIQFGGTGNKRIYINNVGAGQRKDFNIWYYTEN